METVALLVSIYTGLWLNRHSDFFLLFFSEQQPSHKQQDSLPVAAAFTTCLSVSDEGKNSVMGGGKIHA